MRVLLLARNRSPVRDRSIKQSRTGHDGRQTHWESFPKDPVLCAIIRHSPRLRALWETVFAVRFLVWVGTRAFTFNLRFPLVIVNWVGFVAV